MHRLDFHLLTQQFGQWASSAFDLEPDEWIAIDGKSIKGTVIEQKTAYQNFVGMVSVYSSRLGVVLATEQFESKQTSQLKVVQTLLETLRIEGVVFTLDALHCQKNYKTDC